MPLRDEIIAKALSLKAGQKLELTLADLDAAFPGDFRRSSVSAIVYLNNILANKDGPVARLDRGRVVIQRGSPPEPEPPAGKRRLNRGRSG